jgi:uncharacterized membrane protein YkoI
MTYRPARRAGITALALTLGVTLAACSDSPDADPEASPTVEATPEASASPSGDMSDDASAEPSDEASGEPSDDASGGAGETPAEVDPTTAALQAIATAESEAGGIAYSVDQDSVRNVWEVDVAVDGGSIEVAIDASGSEVQRTENDDLDPEDRDALDAATVHLAEAIQRVVGQSGGALDDADLDVDGGAARWNVTVLADDREQDYLVDTTTGEVTRDTDD